MNRAGIIGAVLGSAITTALFATIRFPDHAVAVGTVALAMVELARVWRSLS